MSETLARWLMCATLCTFAIAAQAQDTAPPRAASQALAERCDPLDAKAAVPALNYLSSFSRYRGLADDKPVSWREANDTVARIGGWRAYAREAQQPEAPPSGTGTPSAPKPGGSDRNTAAPMAVPPGHTGHRPP